MKPTWTGNRWRIQARKDGKRYSFSSSIPGIKGRKECQLKYDNWYYGEASGEKTVGQICKEFLNDVKARRGDNSPAYEQYETYIRLYIAPVCSSKKICKMTLRDWQNVINGATGQNKPLSDKTLRNLRGIIMGIVKFAYEDYQCEPLRGSLYIPKGHPIREKEILQKEDVRKLFEPSPLWYHPLFCFLALTGMRPSEALGIKIGDLKGDRVYIQRGVTARRKISEGKNKNARRMVPIGSLANSIIKSTIERNERYNLHTEWVFCSSDGTPGNQTRMRKQWAKLKAERGLPNGATVYSLRHTFISLMKNVMPEQMIKDIVGHSVSMPTFKTYGHLLSDEPRQAAEIIDLSFGDNFGDKKSITDGQ